MYIPNWKKCQIPACRTGQCPRLCQGKEAEEEEKGIHTYVNIGNPSNPINIPNLLLLQSNERTCLMSTKPAQNRRRRECDATTLLMSLLCADWSSHKIGIL